MKQNSLAFLIIVVSVFGILVLNSAYVVDQTEQVVITQFGEPIGDPILKPGLKWKLPFFQEVHRFDKRILEWDGYPSEIPTRDKKFIWVDVTGRWKIVKPLVFLQAVNDERSAQTRLDDVMDGATRNVITKYRLSDIVRSSNKIMELPIDEDREVGAEEYERIEIGRDEITREIFKKARSESEQYGIELIDLRIKRINYISSVQKKVFERMISERFRAAEQLRSEGQGKRAEIDGLRDKELKRITSEAYRESQKLKGAADAEATRIYGEAYSQDPDFYGYIATLEKYPETLKDGRLILTTDSDFLKYLKKSE